MNTTFLHKQFALCRNLDKETRTIDKNQELKNKGKKTIKQKKQWLLFKGNKA